MHFYEIGILFEVIYMHEIRIKIVTDRSSKKLVFRCDIPDIKKLKQITLDNDTTLNALLLEGIRYILNKYENKKK